MQSKAGGQRDGTTLPSVVLLDASPAELDFGDWHVESLSLRGARRNWSIPVHVHPGFHQMFVLDKGTVDAVVDGEALSGIAPAVLIAPFGAPHGFRFARSPAGHVLTFKTQNLRTRRTEIAEAVEDRLFSRPAIIGFSRSDACWRQLLALMGILQAENLRHETDRFDIKRLLLESAIAIVARTLWEQRPAPSSDEPQSNAFRKFERLLDVRLCDHLTIAELARQLGLSESTLNRICRMRAGCTAARYVRSRLFLEARRRLAYSDATIQEIAYDLGFADLGYFSRFISRESGASPRELRKSLRAVAGKVGLAQ